MDQIRVTIYIPLILLALSFDVATGSTMNKSNLQTTPRPPTSTLINFKIISTLSATDIAHTIFKTFRDNSMLHKELSCRINEHTNPLLTCSGGRDKDSILVSFNAEPCILSLILIPLTFETNYTPDFLYLEEFKKAIAESLSAEFGQENIIISK